MLLLTKQRDELQRIANFLPQTILATIAKIELLNGRIFIGVVRSASGGTRTENFRSYHYGGANLETLEGSTTTIDLREEKSVERVWDKQKNALKEAGIVTIVDLQSLIYLLNLLNHRKMTFTFDLVFFRVRNQKAENYLA
jgi:hypothetical protein